MMNEKNTILTLRFSVVYWLVVTLPELASLLKGVQVSLKGFIMTLVLTDLIHHHARFRGDKQAIVFAGQHLNWLEFSKRVNQLSHALKRSSVSHGDKVATLLPNCLELITLYWAVTSIGAVVVPLSPLLQKQGMINLLNDSDSRVVFLSKDAFDVLQANLGELNNIGTEDMIVVGEATHARAHERFVEGAANTPLDEPGVQPDDLFNIVYSSGTTGTPKGIEHTHLIRAQYGAHFAASFRMTPESVVLQTGSIIFNGAFVTLMPSFFLGAKYVLHPYFDAEKMIQTIKEERVSHAMMVPSQIIAVLESPNCTEENLASLEMVLTLGAPLLDSVKARFTALLPGRLYELYGLTEGFVTILDKYDFERKTRSVGCPPPGYQLRIVDESGRDLAANEVGEIVGKGPIKMRGYYKQPELTAHTVRDGWIYTGDLGYVDEEGYLYLVDRKKDMILSGGVNVYPRDIEEVISNHPDVVACAVFGVASDKWGETPVAALVLRNQGGLDEAEMKNWINERVEAKFQRVSEVMLLKALPQNVAGKTLKNKLQEMYHDR